MTLVKLIKKQRAAETSVAFFFVATTAISLVLGRLNSLIFFK